MTGSSASGLRNYAIVTAAYWGFTLTDGALRMLVLFTFFQLGYSPFTLAFLFLLYEAAGIGANFIGGWLAARYGITRMLTVGLVTQIAGFLLLSAVSPEWGSTLLVTWVLLAQGVCGVAKDLTKTASKSAIKITESQAGGEAEGRLFRWVAWFTGSKKNAMKGVGFFLGGLLLQLVGFRYGLWLMAGGAVPRHARRRVLSPRHDGQGQGQQQRPRAVRQVEGHQSSGGRPRRPVRRAGRVVRGRRAGVPLCQRLDLHHGRRLPRAVDHRLRAGAGGGALAGRAQPRRPVARGAGGARLVAGSGHRSGADRRDPRSRAA
ncbi:hypothetical protein ACFSKM_20660 [Ancylobacter dichloromethanicus]